MKSLSFFSYLPNSAERQQLQQDLEIFEQFDGEFGDKLAINPQGELLITKGGFLQAAKRTVLDLRYGGGYNRNDVATRIGTITKQLEVIGNALCDKENDPNIQDIYTFRKKVKLVQKKLVSIEYASRLASEKPQSTQASIKLEAIRNSLKDLQDSIKKLQEQKDALPFETRPKIDYQKKLNPLHLHNVRTRMRKRETPQNILAQAQTIENQRLSTEQRVARHALLFFSGLLCGLFTSLGGWLLLPAQHLLYNPIKRLITGEATAKNFLQWFDTTTERLKEKLFPPVEEALPLLANQLLEVPVISDEHVEAFVKLAPNVQSISIIAQLVSNDLDELIRISNLYNNEEGKKRQNWLHLDKTQKEELQAHLENYFNKNCGMLPLTPFEFLMFCKEICHSTSPEKIEPKRWIEESVAAAVTNRISCTQLEQIVSALGKNKKSSIHLGSIIMSDHGAYITNLMKNCGFEQSSIPK